METADAKSREGRKGIDLVDFVRRRRRRFATDRLFLDGGTYKIFTRHFSKGGTGRMLL